VPPNTTLAMTTLISPARLVLTATSLGGFGALGWGLAVSPLPVGWLAAGLVAHTAVCTAGTLFPSLRAWSDVAWRGTAGRGVVALTFDDGPHPETTRRVLALLSGAGATATFFVLGSKAERHPDVVREITNAGHEVALHGYSHDRLYSLRGTRRLRADIARGMAALATCGVRPVMFRPPVGFVSHAVALAAESEGLRLVGHSTRGLDGRASAEPASVLRRAKAGLRDGAVLLLHDAAERGGHEPASLTILAELLSEVKRRGLRPVTMSALFEEGH
jgi:peptidoglycan/xylan/chitin deacetylase (PgdA/CDA1 family)